MAARINTKFVIILIVALLVVGGVIGGLWYLQIKGDATRNVAEGDKYFEAGDYDRARAFYGRAVSKEPGRIDYIRKLEAAILQMRPTTTDRASELYRDRVNILRHEARHYPFDVGVHLRLLEELVLAARTVQQPEYWEHVETAADDMWDRVSPTEPERYRARVYRAQSVFARAAVLTPEEMAEAETDLLAAADALAEDDLAWATLAHGQLIVAEQLRQQGQTRRSSDKFEQAESTLRRGLEAVPEGPELARAELLFLLARRARDAESVTEEQLLTAADRLMDLVGGSDPAYVVTDAAEVLRRVAFLDNGERIITLLERYLEEQPDSHQLRYYLARVHFLMRNFDAAGRHAQVIKDSEPLAVSFPSRLQGEMRKRASALLVDVAQSRWENASPEQQAALVSAIETARNELAGLVTDPESDLLVTRADGKLAFAKGDYHAAAGYLEQVIEDGTHVDAQVLMYSATSLQQIGTIGLALDRVAQAVELTPSNVAMLLQKARLETELGRFDAAKATLARIEELGVDDERASALRQVIANRERGGEEPGVIPVLQAADAAFARGDVATSRSLLTAAMAENPDDTRVIEALARLEMSEENKAEARRLVELALKAEPDNRRLAGMAAAVEIDDPVDAMAKYLDAYFDDEGQQTVAAALNFANLATSFERRAETSKGQGLDDDAAESIEVAKRARQRSQQALAEAKRLLPENTDLIEFEIFSALRAKNWNLVERLISEAGAKNLDHADGLFYQGRYELYRERYEQAAATLERATSKVPYSNPVWQSLASAYFQLGDYPQALRAAEQAYKCNPNDVRTVEQYVNLLVRLQQKGRALSILRSTRNRFMGNQDVREAWLNLEADVGDAELALAERRAMYKAVASNVTNAVRLATLLNELEPTRGMIKDANGTPRYGERAWERLGSTEQQKLLAQKRADWRSEADRIVDGLMEQNPDDLGLVQVKASLLRTRGKVKEGEQLLRDFIEAQDEEDRTARMYLTLGGYLAEIKSFTAAIRALEEGRKYQSEDTREADLALATLHSQLGDFEKSLEHYARVNEVASSRRIQLQMIEMQTRGRKFDQAEALLDSMEADGGPDYLTTMLRASIAEGRGEMLFVEGDLAGSAAMFAAQREALAEAQALNPSSPTPQIMTARGLLRAARRNQKPAMLDDALMVLEQAEEIRAGTLDASLVRVDIYRERDDRAGAIAELSRLLEGAPEQDRARRLLLQIHIDEGEDAAAIEVARGGVEANPSMAYWHEMLGDLYALKQQDFDRAGESYKRAYDLAPGVKIVSKLADVWLASEKPKFEEVVELLGSEQGRSDPLLAYLYAKALDEIGRRDDAVKQVQAAFAMHNDRISRGADPLLSMDAWFRAVRVLYDEPEEAAEAEQFVMNLSQGTPGPLLLRGIASVWFAAGEEGWTRALELQQQAIAAASGADPAVLAILYLDLGQYQIVSGDFAAATETFRRLLEIDPENIMGLNNYAYLLTEHGNKPAEALPHAQKAAKLDAGNADVLDTLGWIEFKMGQHESARQHLLESIREKPAPSTYFHLAQTLVALDRPREAQDQLERALQMDPDDETKAEIEALSDDIRTRVDRTG